MRWCKKCGSKDSEYSTADGTMRSNNPVYDG